MTQDETVGQDEYYVDKIIGKERRPEWGGKFCYKVLWMNYGPEAATWEPVENFKDFDEAIKYEESHKDGRPQKRERAKTPAKTKQVRKTRSDAIPRKKVSVPASVGETRVVPKPNAPARVPLDNTQQKAAASTPEETGAGRKFTLSADTLYANVVIAAETEESINNAELPAEGKSYRLQEGVEVAGLYGMHCYGDGKIAVFVQYKDGLFEYLPLELAEEKCPQMLLRFYRHHISSSSNEGGRRP